MYVLVVEMEVVEGTGGDADQLDRQSEHDEHDRHSEHSDHDQNAADLEGSKSVSVSRFSLHTTVDIIKCDLNYS